MNEMLEDAQVHAVQNYDKNGREDADILREIRAGPAIP